MFVSKLKVRLILLSIILVLERLFMRDLAGRSTPEMNKKI
jgi:hypothetical protein